MATTREDILLALQARLATDAYFPLAEIDAEEPEAWITDTPGLAAGLSHAVAVQDCPEPEVTRDAGGEADWELRGEFAIAYAVMAAPKFRKDQRARRDLAARKIAALIASDRTLGLDPSVYAEVGPATRHNAVPLKGAAPAATVVVPINVDYIAPSAAG